MPEPVTGKPVWQLSISELESALGSSGKSGLDPETAGRRLSEYGPNQLQEKAATSPWRLFFAQFEDFIIWVLIGAALVSGFLKEWVDALAILGIVVLNSVLGFIQEYRAEKSLAALKKLASPVARVWRGGCFQNRPAAELVPGDLIELEAGDHVPADGRIVYHTNNFSVLEASLTGESTPVLKTSLALEEPEIPLADRANQVYLGTSVSSGKARALVVATGMSTELGRIAGLIQTIGHETTPLQKKLEEFGRFIVYICLALVVMVFLLEWWRGGKLLEIFLTAVSLAVAAIPEGLPAVVTIALAMGVQRMVRRHVLIRKLPAVETLGCTTVICSDKTGTLTRNEMTVQVVYAAGRSLQVTGTGYEPEGEFRLQSDSVDPAGQPTLRQVLETGVLCNSAVLSRTGDRAGITGDPTEGALLVCAAKAGILKEPLEAARPLVEEIPFDSERKLMSMIRRVDGELAAYVKGAPDLLLLNCNRIDDGRSVRELTAADREEIQRVNLGLADQAMRVLAFAWRPLETIPGEYSAGTIERDLVFLGLMAMIDPLREEARRAIARCHTAGIRTVMITGDHRNTAVAIARQLGIFGPDSLALSGEEVDALDDQALFEKVDRIPVYARVSPEHKLRIVRAWRRRGEVVAMTGDGVNDAPAVKEASIGIAMGIAGTDVTKEVADMVITDDNFASIEAAVEEGRGIYDNIQKFIHYLLSCNAGEILVMFAASLIGLPVPLLPIQILWVNLATDGFPALALGVDPFDPDVMDRPPRPANASVVTRARIQALLLQGSFIAFCSLMAFLFVLKIEGGGLVRARSMAFFVLACSQLFHAYNCRHPLKSIFQLGIFSNRNLVLAAGFSFLLLLAVIYLPPLAAIFKSEPLPALDLAVAVAFSSFPLWGMELVKVLKRRKSGRSGKLSGEAVFQA